MDTITWNGQTVTRIYRAYQSRMAGTTRSKFGGTSSYPDEYAVQDQQGLIVARFATMAEAEAYANTRNV